MEGGFFSYKYHKSGGARPREHGPGTVDCASSRFDEGFHQSAQESLCGIDRPKIITQSLESV